MSSNGSYTLIWSVSVILLSYSPIMLLVNQASQANVFRLSNACYGTLKGFFSTVIILWPVSISCMCFLDATSMGTLMIPNNLYTSLEPAFSLWCSLFGNYTLHVNFALSNCLTCRYLQINICRPFPFL